MFRTSKLKFLVFIKNLQYTDFYFQRYMLKISDFIFEDQIKIYKPGKMLISHLSMY